MTAEQRQAMIQLLNGEIEELRYLLKHEKEESVMLEWQIKTIIRVRNGLRFLVNILESDNIK